MTNTIAPHALLAGGPAQTTAQTTKTDPTQTAAGTAMIGTTPATDSRAGSRRTVIAAAAAAEGLQPTRDSQPG